ncbi:MAG: hypothetical protein GY950_08245 [bacterium]|nr:hypothetical protein [bacterium]
MSNILNILMLLVAIVLPIVLGYFFRMIKLFDEKEINALRKFVVKVSVPFLIFKNLYKANIESLGQLFPAAAGYLLLTVFFTITGYFVSRWISPAKSKQNAYAFSVFAGNYAFLGWGVVYMFYGDGGLTRAVFFTMFFWPIFLLCGFWMVHREKRGTGASGSVPPFLTVLIQNASVPLITSIVSIGMNMTRVPVPSVVWDFVEKFAAFSIPMILFTIGLNFKLKMPRAKLKVLLAASLHRLVLGFGLGLLTLFIIRLIFNVDLLLQKMLLIESVMPTATMTVFYIEYTDIDKELHAGIIAFSTMLSLLTIPFWYVVVEHYF